MKVQPKDYLNQNIEVMTSNFRAGKIDAAVIWEPTASRLVEEGLAQAYRDRRIGGGKRRRFPRDARGPDQAAVPTSSRPG